MNFDTYLKRKRNITWHQFKQLTGEQQSVIHAHWMQDRDSLSLWSWGKSVLLGVAGVIGGMVIAVLSGGNPR